MTQTQVTRVHQSELERQDEQKPEAVPLKDIQERAESRKKKKGEKNVIDS